MVRRDDAPLALLHGLKARNYRFITTTPATHARVIARPVEGARTLADIFGWSRSFAAGDLDGELLQLLHAADAIAPCGGQMRSRVRVSTLGEDLFLHSAFPTDDEDSIFFGPDTYRFARFLRARIPQLPAPKWIVDMGAGSGAGGIVAASIVQGARVTLVDVNPAALQLARINGQAAGVVLETLVSDHIPRGPDLVIANPPYLMDEGERAYRDGGDLLGGGLSRDWAVQALSALAPGGTMLLYTGAAFVGGKAPLISALESACADARLQIEELDVDVFGEELDEPAYSSVERIGAIGAVISRDPTL